MTDAQAALRQLVGAIAEGDRVAVARQLSAAPELASLPVSVGATRADADHFLQRISHYVYAGDTALHIAAAAYQSGVARDLLALGADVAARNRRGATALHYAADGIPGSAYWDPPAQAAMIGYLVQAGADPNALDRSGVAPLHRAVRTRCGAAVSALLDGGADPHLGERLRVDAVDVGHPHDRSRRLGFARGPGAARADRARTATSRCAELTRSERTRIGRHIDSVLAQRRQWHDTQHRLVRGAEHHRRRCPVVVGPGPIDRGHAPTIAGHQAYKAVQRLRS
jgi:hypothetical protein